MEDNALNQQVALRILKKAGIEADLAMNGQAALDAFRNRDYDLILMDIQMPGMNGYELTACIRAEESAAAAAGGQAARARSRVPIIALTAHALNDDCAKCLEVGMDDYIAKPLDQKALIAKVQYWLGSKSVIPQPGN